MEKPNRQSSLPSQGKPINWNQVYYFSEVASLGSIKDAAEKLGLSPSTLSEHIAQLEEDLGVQLFHRQHRKLVLTGEGSRLYLRAKEMFEAGQRLVDVISPVPLGCFPISVGLVPTPSIPIAYQVIGDFLGKYGPLNMKLVHARYSELYQGLTQGAFDIGFSDRVPDRKDLRSRLISSSCVRFYVSSKWANERFTDLIHRLPLLICNAEPATRTLVEQGLGDAGFVAPAVVTSDYPSVLVELCERGIGIGVFGEAPIKSENENLRAFRVPKDAPKLYDNLYVLWANEGENREAVRRFKEFLPSEK